MKALVCELFVGTAAARISIHSVVPVDHNAALSWVTWTVAMEDPAQDNLVMKSLFIWQNTTAGWRIKADMYASGALPQ